MELAPGPLNVGHTHGTLEWIDFYLATWRVCKLTTGLSILFADEYAGPHSDPTFAERKCLWLGSRFCFFVRPRRLNKSPSQKYR